MKAATYARFSTDRQSESSITDQLRICREYAARLGVEVASEYRDEGVSGAALGNRPGVLRALAAVESGDVLLVADLSRLSRSQELAPLLDRLRFRGVRVIGVLDGFDSESPQARMQAGLSGIMSDEFRASIRARTHLALESRAKSGRATGGRAYGFASDGCVRDDEAAVVREVFRRVAGGESMKAVAADLNRRGVASPGADWKRIERTALGRWQVPAIHELLGNERYVGRVIWNRSRWVKDPDTGKRVRRERPREEWVVTEGPAIVEPATFEAVAKIRSARVAHGGGRGGGPRYVLSGILRCAGCGAALVVTGKGGSHYYCPTYRNGGRSACSMTVGARRDVAEEVLLSPIERLLLSPEAIEVALDLMKRLRREQRARTATAGSSEVAALEAEAAELRELAAARPGMASLRAAVADVEQRLEAARRAAQQGWRNAAGIPGEPVFERAYRDHARRIRQVLAGRTAAGRVLLREILKPVPCRPDESGRFLIAERVGVDPAPLVRAAGEAVSWNGSGGRI